MKIRSLVFSVSFLFITQSALADLRSEYDDASSREEIRQEQSQAVKDAAKYSKDFQKRIATALESKGVSVRDVVASQDLGVAGTNSITVHSYIFKTADRICKIKLIDTYGVSKEVADCSSL